MIEAAVINVRAFGHWILVRPAEETLEKSKGGVFLPHSAQTEMRKEMTNIGTIAHVGHGQWIEGKRVPLEIKVGQRVAYGSSVPIVLSEVKYDVIREADIIAVLEDEEPIQG